jgi:hypothetical protein
VAEELHHEAGLVPLRANSMEATSQTTSERYLRHIRNAVVILATLAFLSVTAGAIFGMPNSRTPPMPADQPTALASAPREDAGRQRQSGRTFSACGPFCPWVVSNSTFWFSFSDR